MSNSVAKYKKYNDDEVMQNILSNLSGSINKLEENQWVFERSSKIILDFNCFTDLSNNDNPWFTGSSIEIIDLAKILFLKANQNKISVGTYKQSFDAIYKTIFYLSKINQMALTREGLCDFFIFYIMHDFNHGQLIRRITPLAHQTVTRSLDFDSWIHTIKASNICKPFITTHFTQRIMDSEMKKAISIISANELTFTDWKDGGNLDRLTLDYGRYYIEHCNNFFIDNICMALALQKTRNQIKSIANNASIFNNDKNTKLTITPIINNFLSGVSLHNLPKNYSTQFSRVKLEYLQNETLRVLKTNLYPLIISQKVLSDENICNMMNKLNLEHTNEHQKEWVKRYISAYLKISYNSTTGSTHQIFSSIVKTLQKTTFGSSINVAQLDRVIDDSYLQLSKTSDLQLPDYDFYKSRGVISESCVCSSYSSEFITKVKQAGLTLFLALTGWRSSEYAFSLNDIRVYINDDILDQLAHPLRYEIKWVVPKTNSETKLDREITDYALQCALSLSELVNANKIKPCLYHSKDGAKEIGNSTYQIYNSTSKLWRHFVKNYPPFIKLDLLAELGKLSDQKLNGELDSPNKTRLSKLLTQCRSEGWHNLKNDHLLVAAHLRANNELSRVSFFINDDRRKNYVKQFIQNTLNSDDTKIVNEFVSDETKDFLSTIKNSSEVTGLLTDQITSEIMSGCLYPTPHAFRHMWAEAVFRRFDGDAGWMIRSTFKHVNPSMWLAYVRNKDNHGIHQQAKRKVISSLLLNHVLNADSSYAGALDTFLRRVFAKTKTANLDQLTEKLDLFAAEEIIDIKSGPWGYCLLRKRNQSRAKCAVDGIPQRQNAAPKFCFGCSNNLAQETHIEGILLNIANDIKVLNTPGIPDGFVRESFTTVKNALTQLTKLGADESILLTLKQALDAHRNRIIV